MLKGLISFSLWFLQCVHHYILLCLCTLLYDAGMIAVALTPNMKIAAVCSSYMYSLFHLFAGFVITQVNMPGWW